MADPVTAGKAAEEMTGDAEIGEAVKMSAYGEHLMQWAAANVARGG